MLGMLLGMLGMLGMLGRLLAHSPWLCLWRWRLLLLPPEVLTVYHRLKGRICALERPTG